MSCDTELLFFDAVGAEWSVRDSARRHGRHLLLPLGSERAESRIFVSQFGQTRAYAFAPRERRGTRPSHLQRQLDLSRELAPGEVDPALALMRRTGTHS